MAKRGFPAGSEKWVDLRSDTVTRPTPAMYQAMMDADLGDDVLGDEPTVARLERLAAEMVGKEAALFVPSGTMGNQIALAVHCRPGDAVLFEEEAHMLYYEVGAPGAIAGVVSWTLPSDDGGPAVEDLARHCRPASLHTPGTKLICLENSHNRKGGTVISLEKHRAYRALADDRGVKIHLDGARVFNAAAAMGVEVREIAATVDTVNFCLSKGLRSPVGSLLCGPVAFIEEARIWRKRLGGGMRQSGLLAACGLVSLTQEVARLAEDHARARRVAEAVQTLDVGASVELDRVQTNIVLIHVDDAARWAAALEAECVLAIPFSGTTLRLVFHADIDDGQADRAVQAFAKVGRS